MRYTGFIILIALLPVIGELMRVPFLGGQGVLISDVAIGILVICWVVVKISKQEKISKNIVIAPLLFFTGIALFSLLQSLIFLQPTEVLAGSFYLVRFIEYTLLAVIIADKIKTPQQIKKILYFTIFSAVLIAIAGFIQLAIYPDLGKLKEFGWDPHINRLVSTWLDPNFVGGLFSLMISLLLGIAIYTKGLKKRLGLFIIIAVFAAALFLTYSRSAYIAAGLGIITIGLLKSRKILIMATILGLAAFSILPRAQERANDLIHSAQSLMFNTAENPDPTARLRIKSWDQTLQLIIKRPLLGGGYNTLRSVKFQEGFVENTAIHSASGSDSSVLTILATTGILGLIPFLWLYLNVLKQSFRNWNAFAPSGLRRVNWFTTGSPDIASAEGNGHDRSLRRVNDINGFYPQGYGLGLFAGTISLIGHSFFVNSLLFPQIMIFIWILAGILMVFSADVLRKEKFRF